MKFKAYLNEGRTKEISADDAIKIITEKCKNNYKKLFSKKSSLKIYRGLRNYSGDFGIADTNKGRERESANTDNYYTLLFDNLPSWKSYPKRSRGLICTTNVSYAVTYGQPFYVIPFDDTKIAIAPENDMWVSFPSFCDKHGISSLNNFNLKLNSLIWKYNLGNPKTYEELKKVLVFLNNKYFESGMIDYKNDYWRDINKFIFGKDKDIISYLNKKLSPNTNGFKLGLDLKKDKEVWIQGSSIILSYHGDKIIEDELKDRIL